jgi:hypothetical protein
MRLALLALRASLAPVVLIGLAGAAPAPGGVRPVDHVEKRVAQFSPTPLSADLSALGEQERQVLGELAAAAKPLDQVFLRQAWTGNPELRRQLAA